MHTIEGNLNDECKKNIYTIRNIVILDMKYPIKKQKISMRKEYSKTCCKQIQYTFFNLLFSFSLNYSFELL